MTAVVPFETPRDGPDIPENTIVVCPTHYDGFDSGMLTMYPGTLAIQRQNEEGLSGRKIAIEAVQNGNEERAQSEAETVRSANGRHNVSS